MTASAVEDLTKVQNGSCGFTIIMYLKFYTSIMSFTGPSDCFKIIKMAMERDFQPVIAFSFSKKDCEAYALQVAKLDFNTGNVNDNCMSNIN